MNINFKSIKLYNFLSYHETEYTFEDGITLVSGINQCQYDNSLSNGSGKSAIFEAILWVLTGETSRGIKDIVNNSFKDEGAYVEIFFEVDKKEFHIIRSKEHKKLKTNLKIFINSEDMSGKALKDSEKLLSEYLPDMTSQLLSSVIILSQGLPDKFSASTPSKRKEILEQLTKSDFMIEDLRIRVAKRLGIIKDCLRSAEDSSIENDILLREATKQLEIVNSKLNSFNDKEAIEKQLSSEKDLLNTVNINLENFNKSLINFVENKANIKNKLDKAKEDLSNYKQTIQNQYSKDIEIVELKIKNISNDIDTNRDEIISINNIKDICPTCGQKIIGVYKPDLTIYKDKIKTLEEDKVKNENKLKELKNIANKAYLDGTVSIKNLIENLQKELIQISDKCQDIELTITNKKREQDKLNTIIIELSTKLLEYNNNYNDLINQKTLLESNIEKINKDIMYISNKIDNIKERLSILQNFNTIISRDFRGQLLVNVIEFINNKSNEYAKYLFGNTDLRIELNGNNIDIIYSNKPYANLSGGEKQKVDIIIQLALREMLCRYADFNSNIIVFDEITDNLDSQACQKVFNLLLNVIENIKSIYIISHHSKSLDLPYDNELIVIKNNEGISYLK